MIDNLDDGPHVIRILGDMDGHARWVGVLKNVDTGYKAIELLITLNDSEGIARIATRPAFSGAMWSPPIEIDRK
jgi:hypothetical protein